MKKIHRYEGKDIVLTYDARRCIHAGECVRGLPAVFDPARRPWVVPDEADPAEVADVVRRCPTGALHFERAGGQADRDAAAPQHHHGLERRTPDPAGSPAHRGRGRRDA